MQFASVVRDRQVPQAELVSATARRVARRRVPGSPCHWLRILEDRIQELISEPSGLVRSYVGMKPIMHTALCGLAAVLVLTGTAAAKVPSEQLPAGQVVPRLSTTDGAPVELAARPGSEADKLARQLMAREIARARANGTDPLVLVGMGRLNDEDELLFVQLRSSRECGSDVAPSHSDMSVTGGSGLWIR